MVRDADAVKQGMTAALSLLEDKHRLEALRKNITHLGIKDAADRVVKQIEKEWSRF